MRKTLVGLLLLAVLPWACTAEEFSVKASDMRGDMGLMEDFGPTGAVFLPDGKVLVSDRAYTVFHIFDTEGRRFRFLDHPQKMGEANFSGLCWWKDNRYFVTGSHYHIKNNTRFVENRSIMHQIILQSEQLDPESGKENYHPDTALRSSGFYGESCENPGEISGLAMDPKHNRVFFSFDKCLAKDGTVVLFEGQLDKFLARSNDFDLKFIKTDLKPGVDPATGTQYDLTDIAYVPEKGLVMLLSAVGNEGKQFGSNQIWFMKAGFGPAKLVHKDLCPGNHGSGMAIRATKGDEYEAAIVCDNAMDETRIPSRMLYLRGLRLPMR
ncbi:MAG: hypothetical protein U0931_32655 [Vulcanimicrobiota bacterium]